MNCMERLQMHDKVVRIHDLLRVEIAIKTVDDDFLVLIFNTEEIPFKGQNACMRLESYLDGMLKMILTKEAL